MNVVKAPEESRFYHPADGGVVTGTLVALSLADRTPLITYPGSLGSAPVPARTAIDLAADHVGRQVVIVFDGGDVARPIIIGWIRDSRDRRESLEGLRVDVDDNRLVISGKDQIVLQCGRASITLTRAGKVLIKGCYISTSSTGVNRVNGAAVRLN
jgi:hypothetical protein